MVTAVWTSSRLMTSFYIVTTYLNDVGIIHIHVCSFKAVGELIISGVHLETEQLSYNYFSSTHRSS